MVFSHYTLYIYFWLPVYLNHTRHVKTMSQTNCLEAFLIWRLCQMNLVRRDYTKYLNTVWCTKRVWKERREMRGVVNGKSITFKGGCIKKLLSQVKNASEEKFLLLNTKKTKIMVLDKNDSGADFLLDGQKIELVKQFEYLGSLINNKCDSTTEIKRRLAIARKTSQSMETSGRAKEYPWT